MPELEPNVPPPRRVTPLRDARGRRVTVCVSRSTQEQLVARVKRGAGRGRRVQRRHHHRDGAVRPPRARRAGRAPGRHDRRDPARARGVPHARPEGLDARRQGRRQRAMKGDDRALPQRARARDALGRTRRAELHAAALGHRDADVAVRGRGARHRRAASSTRARRRPAGAGSRSTRCAPAAARTTAWTSPARVLIKDNHLAAVDGDVGIAVRRARELARRSAHRGRVHHGGAGGGGGRGGRRHHPARQHAARPDARVREGHRASARELEASGGVTLDNVRAIAETGVDMISVGALTHSAAGAGSRARLRVSRACVITAPCTCPASPIRRGRARSQPRSRPLAQHQRPLLAECDVCGSADLAELRCKVICRNCRTILQSCADL